MLSAGLMIGAALLLPCRVFALDPFQTPADRGTPTATPSAGSTTTTVKVRVEATQASPSEASLYTRVGGYDAVAALTDRFLTRATTDAQLGRLFQGLSNDSKQKMRNHFIDFVCNAIGGPSLYTGRSMAVVHKGLHITESDWTRSMGFISEIMAQLKLGAPEQKELTETLQALHDDVVGH
jgi:hemoglobin